MNAEGTDKAEIEARKKAANIAWHAMKGLWRTKREKQQIMVYKGLVKNALMSGLEALVLLDSETNELEQTQCMFLRKVMQGEAHSIDGAGKHFAVTNDAIREKLGISTIASDLQARRVKWLQKMARFPYDHVNVLAALHCKFPWDEGPQVSAQGRHTVHTNVFLQMMLQDIAAVEAKDQKIKHELQSVGWRGFFLK